MEKSIQKKDNNHNIRPKKERALYDLIRNLYIIYPELGTINNYSMSLPEKYYQPIVEEYHRILTHFITLLNMPYRIKKSGKYITEKEDIIISLQILEIISLREIRNKEEKATDFYKLIKEVLEKDRIFTAAILRKLLNEPKTTLQRKLNLLRECSYIEITGGYKNTGYVYRLK